MKIHNNTVRSDRKSRAYYRNSIKENDGWLKCAYAKIYRQAVGKMKNKYRLKLKEWKKEVRRKRENVVRYRNNPMPYNHNSDVLKMLDNGYWLFYTNPDLFFAINEYQYAIKKWRIYKNKF